MHASAPALRHTVFGDGLGKRHHANAPTGELLDGEELGVRHPVTLAQDVPRYPGIVPFAGIKGIVEIVIDEEGSVESAAMVVPVSNAYDKLLLAAVNKWRYQPSTVNNVAVKFRKRVQISIAPSAR
jgi:TonB family protein